MTLPPAVYKLEGEQAAAEALQFRAIRDWPRWPWMPVKRSTEDSWLTIGVIYAHDVDAPNPLRVFDCNVFELAMTAGVEPGPRLATYESVEAMIADGWRGD